MASKLILNGLFGNSSARVDEDSSRVQAQVLVTSLKNLKRPLDQMCKQITDPNCQKASDDLQTCINAITRCIQNENDHNLDEATPKTRAP